MRWQQGRRGFAVAVCSGVGALAQIGCSPERPSGESERSVDAGVQHSLVTADSGAADSGAADSGASVPPAGERDFEDASRSDSMPAESSSDAAAPPAHSRPEATGGKDAGNETIAPTSKRPADAGQCATCSSDTPSTSDPGVSMLMTDAGRQTGAPTSDAGLTAGDSNRDADPGEANAQDSSSLAAQCDGADPTTIAVQSNGDILLECNAFEIQGHYFCNDDGFNSNECVDGRPVVVPGSGPCLSGDIVRTVEEAWGIGLGFSLNQVGREASPYDAPSHGVIGFEIVLAGDSGGLPIRIQAVSDPDEHAHPFIEVPGVGEYQVLLQDLKPPPWAQNAEVPLDTSALLTFGFFVIPVETPTRIDVCVQSIAPILD